MKNETIAFSSTIEYYESHAKEFVDGTLNVDMQDLYDHFLPLIPAGGHILDLGCGSGRDSRYFIDAGYKVTALDASPAIACLAESLIYQPVINIPVQQMDYTSCFDGVWACASLLHLTKTELTSVFSRIQKSLKFGGALYCSFKYGDSERMVDGRHFLDMNYSSFSALIQEVAGMNIIETWLSADKREGQSLKKWFNAVLKMD